MVFGKREDGGMDRKELEGKLSSDQINVSDRLKKLFPEYINSLALKKEDDSKLGGIGIRHLKHSQSRNFNWSW